MRLPEHHFRLATRGDAGVLAELVNQAGEGMPLYLWGKLAGPGQTAWDVGRARAGRDEGSFSYRNATIIEHRGVAAGCLIGYAIAEAPPPIAADIALMFRPLQELENLAPGTWYVNVLAVLPRFRNAGLGTELLRLAEKTGRELGSRGLSLIVSDANTGARRLYERSGYRETATRPMVKEGWISDGQNWVLMIRAF